MSKKSSLRDTGIKRKETLGTKRNESIRKNEPEKNMIRKSGKKHSDQDSAKVYYDADHPNKVVDMIPEE